MDKNKIVKYVGIGSLVVGLSASGIIYHNFLDHQAKICPLTGLLGIQHQVDVINNDENFKANGIEAYLIRGNYSDLPKDGFSPDRNEELVYCSDIPEEGEPFVTYGAAYHEGGVACAPAGTILNGNMFIKQVSNATPSDSSNDYYTLLITKKVEGFPDLPEYVIKDSSVFEVRKGKVLELKNGR